MRERVSGKCYFEIVPTRDREQLLSIIYRRCRPGTIIFSDAWAAYNDIALLDRRFAHYVVNHALHFVAPELVEVNGEQQKLHTNCIESDWNSCKSRFKQMRGICQ